MDFFILSLLIAAGLAGGVVNAVAGGATLITFPAMLAAGLGPVVANASSAVALTPGFLVAVFSDRAARPSFDRRLAVWMSAALLGGAIGAGLLLVTPDDLFIVLVPLLVGAGTLLYAFSARIEAWVDRAVKTSNRTLRPAALLPACIYGGYFGAGLGVIVLAILRITGEEGTRSATALKNLSATMVRAVAVAIFAVSGSVNWPEAGVMALGALAGGWLGARLVKVLPPRAVYWSVVSIGTCVTLWYAWQHWLA